MNTQFAEKLRIPAAIAGCGAVVAFGALGVMFAQTPQIAASGSSNVSPAGTTTPLAQPLITKAEPSITGPAPLYAGEGPDSNPAAVWPAH